MILPADKFDPFPLSGAAAKVARMHQSPQYSEDRANQCDLLTDERYTDWHPARISDRKLLELAERLESVRSLGDAFAELALSDDAAQRVNRLRSATG